MSFVFEGAFRSGKIAEYFFPSFLQIQQLRPSHPLLFQVLQSILKDAFEEGGNFLSLGEIRVRMLHDLKEKSTHVHCFPRLFLEVELEHHDSQ